MTTLVDVTPAQESAKARAITWKKAWWAPLAVIIVAQTALSIHVIARPPSLDEARYIDAGHQLIYALWHGGGSPYYETYFSGAPDIYSPLAAMADHLGGLAAVRLMSLCFMLTATILLFATAQQLFGFPAGYMAASLLAVNGLTRFIGTYANYDAMALMLLAAAAYCAVRAREPQSGCRWLLLVPPALLAANAAKYASLLFDPAIIMLAACHLSRRGMIQRVLVLGSAVTALLGLAAYLAGGAYVQGILFTTLARKTGASVLLSARYRPAVSIVAESGRWIGMIIALGVASLLVALLTRDSQPRIRLLIVMVLTGLLVTAEAIHLHTDESMIQHDDFSAWFGCIAAGYALASPVGLRRKSLGRALSIVVYGVAVSATAIMGLHYVSIGRSGNGATHQLEALARPYIALNGGRYLISGGSGFHMAYMDHVNIPWYALVDDNYIKYPIPGRGGDSHGQVLGATCFSLEPGCMYLEGSAAYRAAIRAHWFSLISLGSRYSTDRLPTDSAIQQAVEHTPGYVLLTRIGGAPTWIYAPDYKRGLR